MFFRVLTRIKNRQICFIFNPLHMCVRIFMYVEFCKQSELHIEWKVQKRIISLCFVFIQRSLKPSEWENMWGYEDITKSPHRSESIFKLVSFSSLSSSTSLLYLHALPFQALVLNICTPEGKVRKKIHRKSEESGGINYVKFFNIMHQIVL